MVISSQLKLRDCFVNARGENKFTDSQGEEHALSISRIELFEHKNEEFFALGLRDGSVVIKPSGSILSDSVMHHIVPPSDNDPTF